MYVIPVGDGPVAKVLAEKMAEHLFNRMIEDGTLEKIYTEHKEELVKLAISDVKRYRFTYQNEFQSLMKVKAQEIAEEFLGDEEELNVFKKSFLQGIIDYFHVFGMNKMKKLAAKARRSY
jgi:hypothetical protein